MRYDVVIIGGGLGGLECGAMLAQRGLGVCVLEKNPRLGGCLQTFVRHGQVFDTGFHYVGGLAEGQPLHRLFSQMDLLDLPWHRLDEDAFDEVFLVGEHYRFANGYEHFAETLLEDFSANGHPMDAQNAAGLRAYVALMKEIGDNTFKNIEEPSVEKLALESYFAQSAYQFLHQHIKDEKMMAVLAGTSLKMELKKETLPLYTFAQINSSFVQSAWRIRGGGEQIAVKLASVIEKSGGVVRRRANVSKILEEAGRGAVAVELDDGERIEGRNFVCDLHPANMVALLDAEHTAMKRISRKRFSSFDNTFGMLTVQVALKEAKVPYRNCNLFIHSNIENVWNEKEAKIPYAERSLMVSYQVPEAGRWDCRNLDILMPLYWEEVSEWAGTQVGRRGEAYVEFKQRLAELCLQRVGEYVPELNGAVENVYVSTPLTYLNYTGTPQGSAYGIRKDFAHALSTVLSPTTALPNLYMTGQNLNLHGVLGTSMTAMMTSHLIRF